MQQWCSLQKLSLRELCVTVLEHFLFCGNAYSARARSWFDRLTTNGSVTYFEKGYSKKKNALAYSIQENAQKNSVCIGYPAF